MNKILICLMMLIVASCSSIQTIHKSNSKVKHSSNGVDIDYNESVGTPSQKEDRVEIKKNEETVRVGEKGGEVFEEQLDQASDSSNRKNLKISLSFGPGLMRSFGYISILKNLEKNNLTPTIINGSEMGAVVAGLYAAGVTPEMIEWMFFKYFKDRSNYKPYEADWTSEIDEYFLQKVKNVKIEDTRIKFIVTLYDHNTKKAFFFDKGNMRDLILLSLRLMNRPAKFKTGQVYSGAFEREVYNSRLMTSLGGEFNIAVDSLNSNISLESKNEFLHGVLSKVSAKGNIEKKTFDYVINLPLQKMKLDSDKDGNSFLQLSSDYMNSQMNNIKKRIHVKQDILNSQNNKE